MKFDIAESIKDSNENDWVLLSGITLVVALLAIIWFHKHKKLKLLVYDKKFDRYRELIFTEWNLNELWTALK